MKPASAAVRVLSEARAALWHRVSRLDWLTFSEAAVYCRRGPTSFESMVRDLPIPFSRPCGPNGDRLFYRADLDAALLSRRENFPSKPSKGSDDE